MRERNLIPYCSFFAYVLKTVNKVTLHGLSLLTYKFYSFIYFTCKSLLNTPFLSHLLIAGCDIGVQISVRPYVRSFVRPFVRSSVNIYVEV